MPWKVMVVEPARSWLHRLRASDRGTLKQISAAIDILAEEGPALGRPLVDTVTGSELPNLKELRPGSAGTSEIRCSSWAGTRQATGSAGTTRRSRKPNRLTRTTCKR